MKFYLLIGAGFSRNWGGWLAAEAFEFLIGDPAVVANPELRALLWKHQATGGFEGALDDLERSTAPHHRECALLLRAAIGRMFKTMNSALAWHGLEFKTSILNEHPVQSFLLRFSGIFSLNQDLLLEHNYRGSKEGSVDARDPLTERDWQFPGMRLLPTPDTRRMYPSALGTWVPSGEQVATAEEQPIFKLHGSSNWRTAENSEIMILGGGKIEAIARYPVLAWYSQVFAECLAQANARLMIIGYGFRDAHINDVLIRAMDSGLSVFVIDPDGAPVGSSTNSFSTHPVGFQPTGLQKGLQKALIGASRRPVSATFGGDHVELQKIERFFQG